MPFRTFTLLRDPVERTISNLGHYRQVTPEAAGRSLEAIYAEPLRFDVVHNHMVKMFSLTPAEVTNGMLSEVSFTPERLQRAKDRLAGVDVIGVQSEFAAFCAALEARFGWTLGPDGFMNRTLEAVETSDAFRAQIARDNADDVALYRFGCELWPSARADRWPSARADRWPSARADRWPSARADRWPSARADRWPSARADRWPSAPGAGAPKGFAGAPGVAGARAGGWWRGVG